MFPRPFGSQKSAWNGCRCWSSWRSVASHSRRSCNVRGHANGCEERGNSRRGMKYGIAASLFVARVSWMQLQSPQKQDFGKGSCVQWARQDAIQPL